MFGSGMSTKTGSTMYTMNGIQEQVGAWLTAASTTACTYVLCMRATADKANTTGAVDLTLVYGQVRTAGLDDVVRMRRDGYTARYRFMEFIHRYRCLLPPSSLVGKNEKEAVYLILQQQGIRHTHNYQMGLNTVFVREPLYATGIV
jgi:myosin-9